MKNDETSSACGKYRGDRSAYSVGGERGQLENPGLDGTIILKWILKKYDTRE